MRRIATAALIGLAMPWPAQAQTGATTSERVTLSPRTAGRMARQDLNSMLQPEGQFLTGKRVIANEGYLYTRPVGTPYPGLCQRDQIIISYVAIDQQGVSPRNQHLEPYSVRAGTQYRVIAKQVTIDEDERNRPGPFDGACPQLDGRGDDGWFEAGDAYDAAIGYNALMAAASRLRGGSLAVKCDGEADANGSCRDRVLEAAQGKFLWTISTCAAVWPKRCYTINTYGSLIEVRLDNVNTARPEDIESIEVTTQIIV